MLAGDLAPGFSNLYPEILDPAGLSESEYRRVVEKLNGELGGTLNPWGWENIVDGLVGLLTGWVWDDMGLTGAKAQLRKTEKWIEEWNSSVGRWDGEGSGVRIVPLRRTGYMNLDIQIPDPEVSYPASNSEAEDKAIP